MTADASYEIFCACPPGLEAPLVEELADLSFVGAEPTAGGVTIQGTWRDVMRANLWLRGASRVLVRVAEFRAPHLAQLDKRARRVEWSAILRSDVPVKVEATCRRSRIYHAKAAVQRISGAIGDATGAPLVKDENAIRVTARIEDDLCTISLDTSGAPLHRRGIKQAVGKAPLRETMAAAFLRQCGFDGIESVADPMCGSGTFPIEAAEIALGLAPGRQRLFDFERLSRFDSKLWTEMRLEAVGQKSETWTGFGADRDDGAISMARANAERAGVRDQIVFQRQAISDFTPPDGPPGLVMVNPPYGARIGNRKLLFALYGSLGAMLRERFAGWRVGLVTSDIGLAKATELPMLSPLPPVAHGGLKIGLYRTGILS